MNDYISRQAEITLPVMPKKYRKYQTMNIDDAYEQGWDDCQRCIDKLPAADVAPVVYGEWLPVVSHNNTYKCSECGRLLVDITDGIRMVAKNYPYCHCGAKMDGKEQANDKTGHSGAG